MPRLPATVMPPAHAVQPIYVRLLAELLERRGLRFALICQEAEVPPELAFDAASIPFEQTRRLILAALRQSGNPRLGLEYGATVQAHMHGILGTAALASGTLGAALGTIARYAALRYSATCLHMQRAADRTRLALQPAVNAGGAADFIDDAWLVILDRLIQLLAGTRPSSLQFELPQSRRGDSAQYASVLGDRLRFGALPYSTLTLSNEDIDRACMGADAHAHALATGALERDLGVSQAALRPRVSALLGAAQAGWPSAQELARQLHMSPRTLYRRLAEEATSFRELIDEQRREQARKLICDSQLGIEQIAERLGYTDASNFGRSCRRWFGCSPRQLRLRAETLCK